MTTKKDNGIAPFLLDPKDPHYKEPKKPLTMKKLLKEEKKLIKAAKIRRPSIIRAYFRYMVEVILA